jgi:hypothetical protein
MFIVIVNTLAGFQYWTDQDGYPSNSHSEKLKSRAMSLHSHGRNSRHEYSHGGDYSSIVRDAWSCAQGYAPSNGICQGTLLVTLHDVGKFKVFIVNYYFEFISLRRDVWKTQVFSNITVRISNLVTLRSSGI